MPALQPAKPIIFNATERDPVEGASDFYLISVPNARAILLDRYQCQPLLVTLKYAANQDSQSDPREECTPSSDRNPTTVKRLGLIMSGHPESSRPQPLIVRRLQAHWLISIGRRQGIAFSDCHEIS